MPMRPHVTRTLRHLLVLVALVGGVLAVSPGPAPAAARAGTYPVEDYAHYEPATRCARRAQPGTVMLGRFLVRRYGGGFGPITRACGGSRSEHTEGRAFDWTNNVTSRADRARVARFLREVRATSPAGDHAATARRMGIMYIIWNDRMYAAWDQFRPKPYLSSGCKSLKKCSTTLRHRDHVHISLTRPAAQRRTSWFLYRLERARS